MPPPSNIVPATPHDVTRLDGKVERVAISRLTIRQLYTFVELLDENRTPDLVAMCTGKDVEWLDRLTDESYAALVKASVDANFVRAMTLAASDPVIAKRMVPLASRLGMVARLADGLASSALSAASSSLPGGPGDSASTTPSSSSRPSSESTSAAAPPNDSSA